MHSVAKWLLLGQLALAVSALVVVGVSLVSREPAQTSGRVVTTGVLVSGPVLVCGVLLIVAGVLGLVALRRRTSYLRSSLVLLAPLVLAVASSLSAPSVADNTGSHVLSTYDVWPSIEETLRLLEWAAWLVLVAVILSAAAGVLLLLLRRRIAH